ncbi:MULTISPECIES: glycoside hydrolase family 19 protein [Alphaproteobacteria]|uniref:Chitinase n=2 Tax=Alphaproteobacteria TaxID=28211 RepID=A0A512HFZ4_9HYPH|nr:MULTISPECIES: glycoside hydrolase family 19 protein [Alphaproteobacteria]GEO84372.1 chitinase [Ciceribacter naphthalenivorans]GLR22335.1 chitinase [Ciceribacter naphthalenivorans]GLT05191.1 chitinase [Sphingomonas psychrolutea]
MAFDEQRFFKSVRRDLFSGRLTAAQVSGMKALVAGWRALGDVDDPCRLAYCLATAFHETGGRMQPVRETFAASDGTTIARLDRAYAAGLLPQVRRPYWRVDAEGKSWFGRGLVQITHKRNYQKLSEAIGVDLVGDPGRALKLDVAVKVLIVGMRDGLFSGVRLADAFGGESPDWTGARRIVNGRDRAALVAGYGRAFLAALS